MHDKHHCDIRDLDQIDRTVLPADGGPDYNRLIFSQSPYLLQHATNPVDWHPWNEAAFALARQENKPVFLSIGYSTCHWCHVMAGESFVDPTIARLLKESYIAIKVDREERPDVDNLYMNACQLMTGSGGWPLTLVLTPEKQPFFAATYIPRTPRGGMHGLFDLLERITELWQTRRAELHDNGTQLTNTLKRMESNRMTPEEPDERLLRKALNDYRNSFDANAAGFGKAPKFPASHNLSLLLRLGQRFAAPEASRMACATLSAIRAGGVYDQFGFGLHRYAVDADWQIPHFEKMLYDQALFIQAALDAWQVTGEETYAEMARSTISYLLRDLRAPGGGFCCGEDADSEGEEGTFYLWTPDQIAALLDVETAELVCACYAITPNGNFEGQSIPQQVKPLEELAAERDMVPEMLHETLESARLTLLEQRSQRVRPHRDDKVLSGWNGLVIAALSRAGALLHEPAWIEAAGEALAFIFEEMTDSTGRLLRSWRKEPGDITAFAEDYAFLVWGQIELYQATGESRVLSDALQWAEQALQLFGDEQGEFWDLGEDAEPVIGRGRSLVDGALPAPGSVMASNLLRLADLTGEGRFEEWGLKLLRNRLGQALQQPSAFAQLLIGVDYTLGPKQQLVVCTEGDRAQGEGFRVETNRRFLPRLVSLAATDHDERIRTVSKLFDGRASDGARATAYLCSGQTCQPPMTTPGELGRLLDHLTRRDITPS